MSHGGEELTGLARDMAETQPAETAPQEAKVAPVQHEAEPAPTPAEAKPQKA
jgi:hypothetical protein